ncbi:MAG TPA: hypothetical protein VJ112_01135, partial [Rhabdochlamydiaceae bacterium]|nr:hypothetical protein [Rhabdochlamydiaceae bacterium]
YGWGDFRVLSCLGGIICAAVVNDNDLAFDMAAIEELSGVFDVAGDFPALLESWYDNREIHEIRLSKRKAAFRRSIVGVSIVTEAL